MAEYYTYKNQVPVRAGEKLGFTPGRGYYVIPAPTPAKTSTPAKAASTEEIGGLTATQAEQVASDYGLTATTSTSPDQSSQTPTKTTSTSSPSQPPAKHATQPSKAPTKAAKTPVAAEGAAKSTAADTYRPTVFKTSAKAKPNAALLEAAHRQGGTVAQSVAAGKAVNPAAANTKKQVTTSAKTARSPNAEPIQTLAPASKHPVGAIGANYYTYKKEVHLKPGQTLAYTADKGYYAKQSRPGVAARPVAASRMPLTTSRHLAGTLPSGDRAGTRPPPFLQKLLDEISKAAVDVVNGKPKPKRPRPVLKAPAESLSRPLSALIREAKRPPRLTKAQSAMAKKIEHAAVHGLFNVDPIATVKAAGIAGLPLPLALAMLSEESAGGLNIWGDDEGNDATFAGGKDASGRQWGKKLGIWHTVTRAGYDAYRAEQQQVFKKTGTEVKQGIGPTQLTDPQLQADADAAGGAWKPLPNLIIGFSRLAYLVKTYKLDGGLERYNGAPAYSNPVLEKAREWALALGWRSVVSKR